MPGADRGEPPRSTWRSIMPRVSLALIPVSALALVGCAGEQAHRAATPETVAADISGGNLDTVRRAWYRLGATGPGRQPEVFKTKGRPAGYAQGPFTADVFRLELDAAPNGVRGADDAIVRISDPAAWDWQFLAFLDTPGGWRYAGYIDLPDNRVGVPTPRTRTLGPGQSWVNIDVCKQATGATTEKETAWYQLRNGRLVEVLRTPVEGRRIGLTAPFDVAYRAEVLDVFLTPDNRPAVTMTVEAVYTNARRDAFPGLNELFRRSGVARFVQTGADGRFVLDAGSEWSKEELAGLLTESGEQFVHNNRVHLVEMARSGNPVKAQWVARLRHDCASDEVRHELTALMDVDADH
jgi:hypothetical protein